MAKKAKKKVARKAAVKSTVPEERMPVYMHHSQWHSLCMLEIELYVLDMYVQGTAKEPSARELVDRVSRNLPATLLRFRKTVDEIRGQMLAHWAKESEKRHG